MMHKSFQEVLDYLSIDHEENRYISRVFFTNDINTYVKLLEELSNRADLIIRLSDDSICKGEDTIPDLKTVIEILNDNADKNILLPHLAEYFRIGGAIEKNAMCVYSILNRHVHSKTRVWIPIFSGKSLFQTMVGHLDEERFANSLIEIDDIDSSMPEFRVLAYSTLFAKLNGVIDAKGLKEWFRLWDDNKIKSGMSFSTRWIKNVFQSSGEYELSVIQEPYTYLGNIVQDGSKLPDKELGTEEQWASLIQFAHKGDSFDKIILNKLNELSFDPKRLLGNWLHNSDDEKWCLFVWYKSGLNNNTNYLSYSIDKCSDYNEIPAKIENSIFYCLENPLFDNWIVERKELLKRMGITEMSKLFWDSFEALECSDRTKLKLLNGKTEREKEEIIAIISTALKSGKKTNEFEAELSEKYQDLFVYLQKEQYLKGELSDYIHKYKKYKVMDIFSLDISEAAGNIDYLDFDTRGSILYGLKKENPYYLWIDGMGIEWIDLLIKKVKDLDAKIQNPKVLIGTASIPTVTSVNMEKADKETISEKKFDDLDSLSHIKDKSTCNYHSIIVKQFEMMGIIAQKIYDTMLSNPDKRIVITADHGMSRMAAKAFHETEGIEAPGGATVYNHGRYCIIKEGKSGIKYSNTTTEGNIIAYKTHNHFKISGYAPGETHGGATPEEIFVPIILFDCLEKANDAGKFKKVDYIINSLDVYLDGNGDAIINITTKEEVQSLSVDINGNKYKANSVVGLQWSVKIPGLEVGSQYELSVYPNNIYLGKTETITIRRKGLIVDEDF